MNLERKIMCSENLMNSYTVSDELKAVWMKNYKAASSSIVKALQSKGFKAVKSKFKDRDVSFSPTDYFSFMVCRNPYERALSTYKYIEIKTPHKTNLPFEEFIESNFGEHSYIGRHLSKQSELLILPMSYICRFETLDKDWEVIMDKLGVGKLPYTNVTGSGKVWREFFNKKRKDLIYSLYKDDFRNFGYSR